MDEDGGRVISWKSSYQRSALDGVGTELGNITTSLLQSLMLPMPQIFIHNLLTHVQYVNYVTKL